MPKFFMSEADRYACSFSMNEDDWFRKNQRMLLGIANTKFGRELLCIPQEYPQIILIKKNCVHCLISDDGTTSTVVADFRIGAKFANVIRYRWKQFNSYAKYFQLKGWQEIGKSPYILGDRVCALTLTAYPDPHTETTTVDGVVSRGLANPGETFSAHMSGAGTGSGDTTAVDYFVFFACANSSDKYRNNQKTIALFDTSTMTSSATISDGTASFHGSSEDNDNAIGGFTIGLSGSTPASNTALANADYANVGTTRYASDIAYASWTSAGYNNFTMNATGLSNISKTSVTKLALSAKWVLDNVAPTWANNQASRVFGKFADTSGTSTDPKLVVTYTLSSARSNFLLLSIS